MTELYDSKTDALAGGNYSISTGDELGLLSKYVQEGYSTRDANFYLTDNVNITTQGIDVEGAGWVPIGTTLNNHQGISTITYSAEILTAADTPYRDCILYQTSSTWPDFSASAGAAP